MRQIVLYDAAGNVRGRKLVYDYRGQSGSSQKVSVTLKADATIRDISLAQTELIRRAENRSLKSTTKTKFEDVCTLAKKGKAAPIQSIFKRVEKELSGTIGTAWVQKYYQLLDALESEGKTVNTVSNYKSVISYVLHFAYKRRLIDDNPLRGVEIKHTYRRRVLSDEERIRLENGLIACNSPLLWSFRFSLVRPIRKNDLWNLTRENLVLFGELPHIRYYQEKTEERTQRETTLPLADLPDILSYLKALPTGESYLFPGSSGGHMEDVRYHWRQITKAADVQEFHWHDLKRVATMDMLARGYTVEEIIKLGIYANPSMLLKCYDRTQASDILRRHAPVVLLSSSKQEAR